MHSLRRSLCGRRAAEPSDFSKAATKIVSPREIAGTWLFSDNLSDSREALQALVLDEDGSWMELENGLVGKSPTTVRERGEWWLKQGVIHRISEAHERHKDRDRQIQARVIRFKNDELWLYGRFRLTDEIQVFRLIRSSREAFVAHTQHVQDEAHQTNRLATLIFTAIAAGLIGHLTYTLFSK